MGTDSFVGRDLDLARLHDQLQQESRIAITAVTGMGGVGKTELAVQYARQRWQKTFPGGVCWLSARGAEGDADIGTQIITFGKSELGLNPPEDLDVVGQAAFCWRHWPRFDEKAQKPESVLVVLDDVTDYRQVEPYLPRDDRFTVLMTTRVELGSRIAKLFIEKLDRKDSLDLLRKLVVPKQGLTEAERVKAEQEGIERIDRELETAEALCEWLGDLPLGLELVGRFLARKPDLTLVVLRQRLGNDELQARALKQTEEGMTANLGVASAFELSWQELSAEAQELACLLICFALAPIPWERVEACLPEADSENLEDWRDEELVRLSLLKRVERGRYQYHQLIQRFIRTKLPEDSPLIGAFCRVMVAASKEIDEQPTKAQILAWEEMTFHVVEVATEWMAQVGDNELTWPYISLSRFYQGQGLYVQAETWYKQSLVVTRNRLGDDHPKVATGLNALAGLYRDQGRYGEAEPLYVEALNMRKHLFGKEQADVATSLDNLAGLYHDQSRYSEAEPLYVEALNMRKRLFGKEHSDVATSLNNLAGLYRDYGQYSEAEPLYVEALDIYKQCLGCSHLMIAICLNNLALLYSDQGRYSEAEPLYVEALDLRKRLLGDCHPMVAISLNNLALLYSNQGCYEKAEPLYIKALEMHKLYLGDDHPNVTASLDNLAGLYRDQGRHDEAELMYVKTLGLRKHYWGNNHPSVAITLNNLAGLYQSQGRHSKAEPLYVEALTIWGQRFGENHPNTQAGFKNFICCLQQAFNAGQADTLSNHPLTQQLLAQLQSQPSKS